MPHRQCPALWRAADAAAGCGRRAACRCCLACADRGRYVAACVADAAPCSTATAAAAAVGQGAKVPAVIGEHVLNQLMLALLATNRQPVGACASGCRRQEVVESVCLLQTVVIMLSLIALAVPKLGCSCSQLQDLGKERASQPNNNAHVLVCSLPPSILSSRKRCRFSTFSCPPRSWLKAAAAATMSTSSFGR